MTRWIWLLLLVVSTGRAQLEQVFYAGELGFHYSQLFGPFTGDFHVEGTIDTSDWTPTLGEGLGGAIFSVDSSATQNLLVMGAKRVIDTDTTYHVFGMLYRGATSIQPGAVSNPSAVNLFLLWNMDSLAIPEFTDSLDLASVLGAISAEHKFVGAATAMNISTLDPQGMGYSFSGVLVDMESASTLVTVSAGNAALLSLDVGVDPAPVGRPESWMRLAPNPANPGTSLQFQLEGPADVRLVVSDLVGRQVDQRSLGRLSAGPHQVGWQPQGHGLASGRYVMTLWLDGRQGPSAPLTLLK